LSDQIPVYRPTAFYALPSRRDRFWSWLGFGECRAPRPEQDEQAPGFAPSWFIVGTRASLDWKDRIRLLISGKLMVEQAIKTDVPIARSRSTSAISVLPPRATLR
jgi:hypothetical protein